MNASTPATKPDLSVTALLAGLLEKVEHSPQPVGAEQYRSVVMHLVHQFEDVSAAADSAELSALLDAYPAAAEVYENLNYQHAGLCRSSLDAAMSAELRAKQLIDKVRKGPEPEKEDGRR